MKIDPKIYNVLYALMDKYLKAPYGAEGLATYYKGVEETWLTMKDNFTYVIEFSWYNEKGKPSSLKTIDKFISEIESKLGVKVKREEVEYVAFGEGYYGIEATLSFSNDNKKKIGKYADFLDL